MRRVIAVLIAAGLAIGVVVWWLSPGADSPPSTEAVATTTTSTATTATTVAMTTTTQPETTTTGVPDSHVVETVEEAEEILRELWFGWFEGIYNQDEDRIREVVGNPNQVEAAVRNFGVMEFNTPPTPDAIAFSTTEILRADASCLAVWSDVDASDIIGATNDGVHVFLFNGERWMFISQWAFREDLWENDCQSQLLP